MDDRELKLECIRIACGSLENAVKFYAFVTGVTTVKEPRCANVHLYEILQKHIDARQMAKVMDAIVAAGIEAVQGRP